MTDITYTGVREAAAAVGVNHGTVARWIREGRLPVAGRGRVKAGRRPALIRRADLLRAAGLPPDPPARKGRRWLPGRRGG